MGQRTASQKTKKAVSMRLQAIIDERFGNLYQFKKWLRASNAGGLAMTVQRWLPPQAKWRRKPNGEAVSKADWDAIKLPQCATLMEFCDLIGVSADYLLFGLGTPYRSESRTKAELEEDVAVHLQRLALGRVPPGGAHYLLERLLARGDIDVAAILNDAAEVLLVDLEEVKKFEHASVRASVYQKHGITEGVPAAELRYLRDDRSQHPPTMRDRVIEAQTMDIPSDIRTISLR